MDETILQDILENLATSEAFARKVTMAYNPESDQALGEVTCRESLLGCAILRLAASVRLMLEETADG